MPPSPGSNPDQKPIDWVKAHYHSIHGRISTSWKRENSRFELDLEIPANTTATVFLPAIAADRITEGGRKLNDAAGIKFLRMEGDRAMLAVESGRYAFISEL